jgi:hypothetical protein
MRILLGALVAMAVGSGIVVYKIKEAERRQALPPEYA